jgi:hypothetical protein
MCLAIEAGCDPKGSGAAIPAGPIKTAAFEVTGTPAFLLGNYIGAAAPALFITGAPALEKEYTALGVQTLAAVSLTGLTTTVDSQREVDAILALGNGLSSKLDKCASVNIITTDA